MKTEEALMRGRPHPQRRLLAIVKLEERVPKDHPLRRIKEVADAALERLSPEFDRMYASVGRASVPPERLLKASLLIALYSVRSERAFCEEFEYNLLYRWFLDMDLMERSFDATVFTKNRPRLLAHDAGRALFDEVVWAADAEGLLSDEHFSVDGTLIEAAASPGASGPRRDRHRHRTTIRATRRWTSAGNAAATRRMPVRRTPRRACCARAGARKPGWRFWAMP